MGRMVTPEGWLPRGEAVATEHGRDVAVWGGIPGEPAEVRILRSQGDQLRTEWRSSPEPHPQRVEPPCNRWAPCGHCPLMHLSAEGQQAERLGVVRRLLERQGLGQIEVGPFHPSPDGLLGWSNLVKLAYGRSDRGRIRLGTWGRTGNLVPIPECPLVPPTLHRVVKSLAHYAIELDLHPYEPSADRGVLRRVLVRRSRSSGELLVTLVAGRRIRELNDYAELVAQGVSEVAGVWVHINSGPTREIFTHGDQGLDGLLALAGRAWIEEDFDGVKVRLGPGDVLGPNPAAMAVLHERILDLIDPASFPVVVLGCGPGALALQAARRSSWVLGADPSEEAIAHARESARLNNLTAQFLPDLWGEVVPDITRRLAGARPAVVVDTGRKGFQGEELAELLALEPARVAYLCRDPRVLARDLAALTGAGLKVRAVELFDTRPHLLRTETLAVLEAPEAENMARRAPRRRVVRR